MPEQKDTYVIRQGQPKVEQQPVLLTLNLTDEQKQKIKEITGKDVTQLKLSAIELNQVVDAVAFGHGSTVGASY